MKKSLLLGGCLLTALSATAQTNGFDPADFRISVYRMLPQSYPPRELTYGYELAVRNDTVFSYLPYTGRVYQPVFDNDGLVFDAPARDLKSTVRKDGSVQVDFTAVRRNVSYRYRLTVEPDGRALLRLSPSNGQSVSYEGEVSAAGR